MALELFPDNSDVNLSPRISFSHDFCQTEVIPVEQHHPVRSYSSGNSKSSIDFDFCVREISFDQESSSADELFSDGKILPGEIIKKKTQPTKQTDHSLTQNPPLPQPQAQSTKTLKKQNSKERKTTNYNNEGEDQKQNLKSFWGFKRSSSCGSGYGHSLCPLPLLSRSNSTGSAVPNGKRAPLMSKNGPKRSSQSSSSSMTYNNYQKPPLKKGQYGTYNNGNGVQVNHVLNVHSGNLFGLGSIFSSGKVKSKKK